MCSLAVATLKHFFFNAMFAAISSSALVSSDDPMPTYKRKSDTQRINDTNINLMSLKSLLLFDVVVVVEAFGYVFFTVGLTAMKFCTNYFVIMI